MPLIACLGEIGTEMAAATLVAVEANNQAVAVVDGPGHQGMLLGDCDEDNRVTLGDLSDVLANFDSAVTIPDDANDDGFEDLADVSIVLSNFTVSGTP